MDDAAQGERLTQLTEALAGAQAELSAAAGKLEADTVEQWKARAANLTMNVRRLAAAHAAAR
jgi:hypothetical protein